MVRRFVAGVAAAAALSVAAQAADVPYTILLDGRPLTAHTSGTGAIARDGNVFIDVVVATKTFSGLLTFADAGNTVRLSIQHHTAIFKVGNRRAAFDGVSRLLPAAPFKANGDIYVPLRTVARLGGAALTIDAKDRLARLSVRPFAALVQRPPEPGPAETASAAVLSLTPTAVVDAQGALHCRLDVVNTSNGPVQMEFPNGGRVAFVVSRGDTAVWDSTRGMVFNMIVGFKTLAPKETVSYEGVWPGYGSQPSGNYTLTARLMLRSPLVSRPVPVPPVPAPAAPAAHPSAS
jgi:hypothetical protein